MTIAIWLELAILTRTAMMGDIDRRKRMKEYLEVNGASARPRQKRNVFTTGKVVPISAEIKPHRLAFGCNVSNHKVFQLP